MKSKICDRNGVEVKEGDTLILPYITPFGDLTDEEGSRVTVVFDHGCFGYYDATKFNPLYEWQKKEEGEYIGNCGNKVIYTKEYPFWVE